MKNLLLILMAFFALLSCSNNDRNDAISISLTEQEKKRPSVQLRGRKMARDVYSYLNQKWVVQQAANITNSEQSHMKAVETLLIKYNVPYQTLTPGTFSDSELQNLYNTLTSKGNASVNQAYQVGAIIEDLDIDDLQKLKNNTSKADIINVYNKLECGSRNHCLDGRYRLQGSGKLKSHQQNRISCSRPEPRRKEGSSWNVARKE